jgi:SAM-dependent methyltransferase/uncharacterized protein YbaR (Trm112 family)
MPPYDQVPNWILDLLTCPRDRAPLRTDNGALCCVNGHRYPVVDGVPVFLLEEKEQTIGIASVSLHAAQSGAGAPLYVETLGLAEHEKRGVERDWRPDSKVDPAISYLIGATSGRGYLNLVGKLQSYPIPNIPIANGNGRLLLDVGSSWGRWSVSAARKGWRVVGIDPSLGALLAARRAFSRTNPDVAWVCGDARFLPFRAGTFGCAFSYSVIQHFSEADAERAIAEIAEVLDRGGFAKVQMAHRGGLRSTYSRTRPNYSGNGRFRVRYWSLAALREMFEKHIGPARVYAEAFGGLGLLSEDRNHVSTSAKLLITISALLKRLSDVCPSLIRHADSVYVMAAKQD